MSDKTIQALQKIESAVDRTSRDTQDLIKVAWDRLVISSTETRSMPEGPDLPIQQIAAGLAAELREEISNSERNTPTSSSGKIEAIDSAVDRVSQLIERFEKSLSGQMNAGLLSRSSRSAATDAAIRLLESLSPGSLTLVNYMLRGGHLSKEKFGRAQADDRLRSALNELRTRDLFIPLAGHGREGANEELVYWFPPGTKETLRGAIALIERPDSHITDPIHEALHEIGYFAGPAQEEERVEGQD